MPYASSSRRRTPSKGDLREDAILDAAERQLEANGHAAITISGLMTDVGISRAGFYFYFGSKNDVLAALVERTVAALHESIDTLPDSGTAGPMALIGELLKRAETMWSEHGSVMRMALDLAPTVPAIDRAWSSAADASAQSAIEIAVRAGVPDDDTEQGARRLVRALVAMTERSYYRASAAAASSTATSPARATRRPQTGHRETGHQETSLPQTTQTLMIIWQRALALP